MTTADTTIARRRRRNELQFPDIPAPSTLRAHTLPLLLSLALVAAGWAAIAFSRTTYTLEGEITALRDIPWLLKHGFALDVRTTQGRMVSVWLDGRCEETGGRVRDCHKPEFPAGSRIRVRSSDFVLPPRCGSDRRVFEELNCLPMLRGRANSMQRIVSIDVDGQRITSGWSAHSSWALPYLWMVAFAGVLGWYRWRLGDIPTVTVLLLASSFCPLFLAVAGGIWNQLP